jgi:hypothetical protein
MVLLGEIFVKTPTSDRVRVTGPIFHKAWYYSDGSRCRAGNC